jgi:hypothetical protein
MCLLLYIPLFHYNLIFACLEFLCVFDIAQSNTALRFEDADEYLIGLYSALSLAFKHIGNLTVFCILFFFYCSLLLYLLLTSSIIDSFLIYY